MSDLSALLNDRAARGRWEIEAAVAAGRAPQTLVAILPPETAAEFRGLFARLLLCAAGSGTDGCASCEAWRDDGHPDLVIAGSGEKAPGVEECVAFQASLPLRPVIAPRRLGVVPFADELSIPASNALLKIAEEPPAGVHILFTASADNLLPTIRSRAWTLSLDPVVSSAPPSPPPDGPAAWAAWFEATKKAPLADVIADARAWSAWFASRSEWRAAADLENFIYLSDKRHMAVSMVQDALHAILREGVRVEQLFGDLRET